MLLRSEVEEGGGAMHIATEIEINSDVTVRVKSYVSINSSSSTAAGIPAQRAKAFNELKENVDPNG